jgi:dihydrofolate reductase
MGKVKSQISMSLDGYIAGVNDATPEHPIGYHGELLHEWVYNLASWRELHGLEGGEINPTSDLMISEQVDCGVVIMGRRMFDNGFESWGDEPPFKTPVIVVTHEGRASIDKAGGTTFHFMNGDIASVINYARTLADDKDIAIAGGADIIQQALNVGLLDELWINLVPVLIGGGIRLFDIVENTPIKMKYEQVFVGNGVVHLGLVKG